MITANLPKDDTVPKGGSSLTMDSPVFNITITTNKNQPTDPPKDEFCHIEAAVRALVTILRCSRCTRGALQPVFAALDFNKARSLAKRAFVDQDDKVESECVAYTLAAPRFQYKNIIRIIKWNIPPSSPTASKSVSSTAASSTTILPNTGTSSPATANTETSFYPVDFYKRASFRFDGSCIKAQYFYDSGIGIVLQLGGAEVGPLKSALAKDNIGGKFSFQSSDAWRILSIFAGDSTADGPEWPGHPTIEEARKVYNDHQKLKQKKKEEQENKEREDKKEQEKEDGEKEEEEKEENEKKKANERKKVTDDKLVALEIDYHDAMSSPDYKVNQAEKAEKSGGLKKAYTYDKALEPHPADNERRFYSNSEVTDDDYDGASMVANEDSFDVVSIGSRR